MKRALVLPLFALACSGESLSSAGAETGGGGGVPSNDAAGMSSDAGTTSGSPSGGATAPGTAGMPSQTAGQNNGGVAGAATAHCSIWDPIPAGKTLVVIGQDTTEIEEYGEKLGVPGGVMLYTNVSDLAGFGDEVNFGTGAQSLEHWAAKSDQLAIQLGVSLKKSVGNDACGGDHLAAINSHALDGQISSMAVELAALGRPVLLRFGYEFDNQDCHRYEPKAYAQAFRNFAGLLDTLGARNVQMVWHAWGGAPMDINPWYPGDDVVDLVGISLFPLAEMPGKVENVASFAAQHDKPLMIAEAAPQTAHPPTNAASWSAWYQGVFDFIEKHDVRVLSYINQDWNAQSVWASQGVWGSSRLQGTPLEKQWQAALQAPRFLRSSVSLYSSLACHD